MLKIGFFINIQSIHNLKWIVEISKIHTVFIVTHISYKNKNIDYIPTNINIPIYYILPSLYSISNIKQKRSLKKKIIEIIEIENPDIVHSMFIEPYSFYAAMANVKHIITSRGSDILLFYNSKTTTVYKRIIRKIIDKQIQNTLKTATAITCTSQKQKEVLSTIVDNEKIALIPTGIDIHKYLNKQKKESLWKREDNCYYFFSPRAWLPNSNLHVIIDAVETLVKEKLPINVVLVLTKFNANLEYAKCINTQTQNIKENIIILQSLSQNQMIDAYKLSDAVVMIPESDGTPNSALEAMLLEKPIIMGTAKYDSLFFNNNTVSFAETNTSKDLSKVMMKLIMSNQDYVNDRCTKAKELVIEHASLHQSVKKINAIYEKIALS
jgi:glycosyltransferase involved in cell wall biosynthesis